MAMLEIDSFIVKFKNILFSGRNATLTIKSEAGKAQVNLSVELGDVFPPPFQNHHHGSRNGPARQRRRLRRATAHEASNAAKAAEATNEQAIAEKATTIDNNDLIETTSRSEPETLKDEFCSDETFEKVRDSALVENILVTPDCQADWNDSAVTKLVAEKLDSIGIKMKEIEVNRNVRRCFASCLVRIEPVQRKIIEEATFPMRRWTMKWIL